jgi:hypothetical protein
MRIDLARDKAAHRGVVGQWQMEGVLLHILIDYRLITAFEIHVWSVAGESIDFEKHALERRSNSFDVPKFFR